MFSCQINKEQRKGRLRKWHAVPSRSASQRAMNVQVVLPVQQYIQSTSHTSLESGSRLHTNSPALALYAFLPQYYTSILCRARAVWCYYRRAHQ